MTPSLRDFLLALSLANLLFYPVWSELLPGSYGHYYLMNPPRMPLYVGIMGVVLVCAGLGWVGIGWLRRASGTTPRALGKVAFFILLVAALNVVRSHLLRFSHWDDLQRFSRVDLVLVRPLLAISALLLLTPWRPKIFRAAVGLTLALAPFAAVTFSQAAWACVKIQAGLPFAEFAHQPPAPRLAAKPAAPRLLWLLFDALDQRLAFTERPADLQLPHLDAFRAQALYATHAHAPGGSTLESIPALFIGKRIAYARPLRADTLFLQFDDTGQTGRWQEQPSVFTKARALGFNSALVGYYHPYCRVIGHQLTRCFWRTGRWDALGLDDPRLSLGQALGRILRLEAHRLLASVPFVWRLGLATGADGTRQPRESSSIQERVRNYREILEETRRVIEDPSLHLVFIHWPIPHHPYLYDRQRDDFSWDSETNYQDNLALVDRTLGELRDHLERSGQWETVSILITSDHPKISRNFKQEPVPFLLKLPRQTRAVPYEKRWNTLAIPELALALLSGKISDPEELSAWLDQHGAQPSSE